MASLELMGFEDLNDVFKQIADIPEDVTINALEAMGDVAKEKIKGMGESKGIRDPESSAHILDNISRAKPKATDSGGYVNITFKGSRTRGNTTTRNAEIAFINEYGKRGQPARPFIGPALDQNEEAIMSPGEDIIGDWLEKNWQD